MRRLQYIGLMAVALCAASAARAELTFTPNESSPATKAGIATAKEDAPVTISADEMGVDQPRGIVIARGNVEILQGDNILTAKQVTYYQQTDLLMAEGDVVMLQPTGDVFFSDKAELKDGMKRAVVEKFKARLSDDSVLVAERAVKASSALTTLKKASYTPCKLCEGSAPFWQMNAQSATVDDLDETVTYRNAFMEMFGVPVLYTPYFNHPTPDARGKSGFLAPSYATNPYFGSVFKAPYYWRIDEDKDVVITPWATTSEGPLLAWDYRQLTNGGDYQVRGSITNPQELDGQGNQIDGRDLRGHIYAQGFEAVGDDQRVGFDIQRASDDTYLRRYGFGGQQTLFSNAYYEYAQGRNLGLINGLAIQGLRSADRSDTTPLVLPIFQGYYETAPYNSGLKLHVAGDAQWLTRDEGVSQRRLSITPGTTLPMITDGGHVLTASLRLRQDFYDTEDIAINGSIDDATETRTLPQAALEWRLPMINHTGEGSWLLEPIALAVWQANGGNPEGISNEDSTLLELNDTNLFSLERMPGLDLYDAGSRLAYGLRSHYYDISGVNFDGMLGQSYSFNSDTPFPNSVRQGEQFSDYIGRVGMNYAPYSMVYRFALDQEALGFNRNEISLGFNKPWLTLSGSYRAVENNRYLRDSQEAQLGGSLPLDDNWSLYANARRDLELDQMVAAGSGLIYKNECFTLMLDGSRSYARDRDIEPTTQFTVRVGFKNLGEFGSVQ